MKKRGLASLLIVCIVAIAAVVGVVFAFQNAGRQKDVYGSISVTVDNDDINLEVELEKDETTDKKFRIVETPYSSAYFTITVGGLPDSADRSVDWNQSSVSSGVVSIERVTPIEESGKTGINMFKVTGQNGGAPVTINFVTASGAQTVAVKVNVNMMAKDMKLGESSHFGVRQGGDSVNLNSPAILSKYVFYAHPEDVERVYTPNKFPVEYRLKYDYTGVILENGFLTVTNQATCTDQYIDLQVKLPYMNDWLDVPFYVFPAASQIITHTDAYKASTTADYDKVWDLISNRTEQSSANFEFSLDCDKTDTLDYGFSVVSADTKMVRVEYLNQYERSLSTVQNLGEVSVNITAYPIVVDPVTGTRIEYSGEDDANVQITDTIYLRVRNEFYRDNETSIYGEQSFNLKPDRKTVDAFFYEGNQGNYYDVFSLNTGNSKPINMDADIEFELIVEDANDVYSGVYRWDGQGNSFGWDLYSILQIGYWSDADKNWVMLSNTSDNYYTNYLNRFSVAFARTGNALNFLNDNITSMILRAKSVNELSVTGYATCDVKLDVTSAIDKFEVSELTRFDDGTMGMALVYDTKTQLFNTVSVDVYGMVARGKEYAYSERWNTAKVSYNGENLPFIINCDPKVAFVGPDGVGGYYHITYTITADNIDRIEYYKDYPMVIKYTNGESYTFNIRVYPTVESLSMSVISESKGKIYRTITNDYNSSYNYARTAYVRKGYDYQFAIDTPSVNVGAYAVFDQIVDADGHVIDTDTRSFDATQLNEGLYTASVTLHAYSDEVYANHQRTVTVYFVVVDPVGNVTVPLNVYLNGIGDSDEIALDMVTLDGKKITDDTYLYAVVAQENENVVIEQGGAKNKFIITAKYLVDDTFDVGFRVYKSYAFNGIDLDGDGFLNVDLNEDGFFDADEPFVFNYIAGTSITTKVKITQEKPNSITLSGDKIKTSDSIGSYLELVSSGTVTNTEFNVFSVDGAYNSEIGIAFAEWRHGKFELSPFAPVVNGTDLDINGVAVARVNGSSVAITPVQNITSMGAYALVVYARDSLRYVESNGGDLVLPDTYKLLSLYIGSAAEIETVINEIESGNVHDANTGSRNDLNGYNWILTASGTTDQVATLFYTTGNTSNGSLIKANVYYFDDLYTVLGWNKLKINEGTPTIWLKKFVKVGDAEPVQAGANLRLDPVTNGKLNRLAIDLNHIYQPGNDDEEMYSHDDTVVYFEFSSGGESLKFYVAEYINNFDVTITSQNSNGLVSRKNLAPNEFTSIYDSIIMQRGNGFDFGTNLDPNSGWKLNKTSFAADEAKTSFVTYAGGVYSFFPYIELDGYTFNLDALTAKVKVEVKGGVNYLNLVQDSITLDGVTTATYDLTMRVDQPNWKPSLLTYNFLYDGVYYDLFTDDTTVSYVNLEGGKSKLEFKLKCLNTNAVSTNFYYTYYLRIDVSVVVIAPDVDPFYDISGARLVVKENLNNSPLAKVKTAVQDSSAFNLIKQGIYNVSMVHFADTKVVENNKSSFTLTTGQTNSGIIYLDEDSAGGLLVIYPTPYYIDVANISLSTARDGVHTETVLIGKDLTGKPIYDTVTYSIGFTQMIYNETEKYYQPYIAGAGVPRMVSSWSAAEGYKWTGKYYFKTYIVSDSQISSRLSDGTRFKIQISIQGESNAKAITETMTLDAKYRNGFIITPDDKTEDYAVRTMLQTQYQALGTTATYDIALPTDCVPNYANFTLNGVGTLTDTIQSTYVNVTINSVTQTISVYLKADAKAIGQSLEIRIPYRRPGDYINPYLSIVIVPVYFEFDSLQVMNHNETRLKLASQNEVTQLKYRAAFKYDTNMTSSSLSEKMTAFNNSLLSSNLVSRNFETVGQITVQIPYSYVNGVPVLTKNGDFRYAKTFYYYVATGDSVVKRTEYLAVGTAKTYTFDNWDVLSVTKLYLQDGNNANGIDDFWSRELKLQNYNTVSITVSLENRSTTISNNEAYHALIDAGKIVVNVFSTADMLTPQMELTIIPVYFTFDTFKLQNNPVRPIVALTSPSIITVEAGNISAAKDSDVTNAINTFNASLLTAQNNLTTNNTFSFSRIPNDDGTLNFNFDMTTRSLTRADSANPVSATSYLLVSAYVTYVNGMPILSRAGNLMSTYLPVRTFGADSGESGDAVIDVEVEPNGRIRKIAQPIGTSVRYNIALSGVVYDSLLDKYEVRADGTYVWEKNFGWNAVLNIKDRTITVTLDANTDLFDKVLAIMAYSQEGKLMYVLNIVPAYFTVEQLILAEHIDENPVLIPMGDPTWLQSLLLDFNSNRSNSAALASFDFDTAIATFTESLNTSSLVARIDDAGYITLEAGINYEGGIPTLSDWVNSLITVHNTYRYELIDGIPENTKIQALGQSIVYNVNRRYESIKISTGSDANGNEQWTTFNAVMGEGIWAVESVVGRPTCVKVTLAESEDLIGRRIRVGIFVNDNDEEPSYILNIIPAYFAVTDLTVAGQNAEDRNIFLYYGEDPDSPLGVIFDAIYGEHSVNPGFNIEAKKAAFVEELQNTKADLIGRYFDSDLMSGDLHITVYLDYQSGVPTLVSGSSANNAFVVRMDFDFWYAIYGRAASDDGDFPPLPTGPRTRTEVQYIGSTVNYSVDLKQELSMDMNSLAYNEESLAQRGWKASFNDNVFTLEILPDDLLNSLQISGGLSTAVDYLLANDLVFNFYSGTTLAFVLTVQPVLFEVTGVETMYPEQPVYMTGLTATSAVYRAKVKYNDKLTYHDESIVNFVERFNTDLNSAKGDLFEIEDNGKYLILDIALDYGTAGSDYRRIPQLLNVVNNPANVVESYIEYTKEVKNNSAFHNQAIGTTEYYYLGAAFRNATIGTITVANVDPDDVANYVTVSLVNYGSENAVALKVDLTANPSLVRDLIQITINNNASVFTVTIQPVWFLVEGFEVVNHPERHMWLIVSDDYRENVGNLLFQVRARYATNANSAVLESIQEKIAAFNQSLALYDDENSQWTAQLWAEYLDTYTIGGRYFVVRAAVDYDANGEAHIIPFDENQLSKVVYDVFEYVRYSDKVSGIGLAYPNVPRSRTVEITVGYDAVYTIDVPKLESFDSEMVALYTNNNAEYADDDSKLVAYTENGTGNWTVEVIGNNKLYVALKADPELLYSELKVFIYYDKAHVNDAPDSFDMNNVAFILTIRPVLFKITDFTLAGYTDDLIYVDNIQTFTNEISGFDGNTFIPVYEYAEELLDEEITTVAGTHTLRSTLTDFTEKFVISPFVAKSRTRGEVANSYCFQVTTAVSYQAYQGIPQLSSDIAKRIWKSFQVIATGASTAPVVRTEYQAIGSEKKYYLDDSVITDSLFSSNSTGNYTVEWTDADNVTITGVGNDYVANWNKTNPNYITVKLPASATVTSLVNVKINEQLTLQINPVYYEVLGFEPIEHPERPTWVLDPYTTDDLHYRMITTDLAGLSALSETDLDTVKEHISSLNIYLNNGVAPKNITLEKNQYIVFDAAVNYVNGYPEFVKITKDKRNIVESIIEYRVWSANKKPNPAHPSVMGTTQTQQVIGKTKQYTLKNIKGQVYYQYLWVENAGNLISAFENSAEGTTATYEGISIEVDTTKNILKVQLAADAKYISDVIRVYIPYLTTVNGKEVWFSHCIEISPLLFELRGWTIAGVGESALLQDAVHDDYVLLTTYSDRNTLIKYVARINACDTIDEDLKQSIAKAKANLESKVVDYITISNPYNFVSIDRYYLKRNCDKTDKTDTPIGLSTYVVYENGMPELVESSKTLVSNQILVSTGYERAEWEQKVGKMLLGAGESYAIQAVGTSAEYLVEISDAAKIFYDKIKVVEQGTEHPISIPGERANLVYSTIEEGDDETSVSVTLDLAPVVALRNYVIEIRIPYSDDVAADEPNYVYKYYIMPTVLIVEGFYLEGADNNSLALTDREVALELRAKATYSDNVNVRNVANLFIQNLEISVNNAIKNEILKFEVVNAEGGNNVRLKLFDNAVWIQKIGDKTSLDNILGTTVIGYNAGVPVLGGANALTDSVINIQIQVSTRQGETSYFPGWDNIIPGGVTESLQSIGTSREYKLKVSDVNAQYYYDHIIAMVDGHEASKAGENQYEDFDLQISNKGHQNLAITVTFTATSKNLYNKYIDIRVPYTTIVDGKMVWMYYTLHLKPVLFEIVGWKIKIDDNPITIEAVLPNGKMNKVQLTNSATAVSEVTLNDSAVELYFTPDIVDNKVNTPECLMYYTAEEIIYINSAIKRLETEINVYDERISDGYTYLVLNNKAQDGHQVNYTIYREESEYKSYMVRDIAEASTTTLTVSASISYGVTDFSKQYIDGAHAVTAYSDKNTADSIHISSPIQIYTTDQTAGGSDNSTIFINQDNAGLLMSLNSDVNYVLMSDIYLYQIPGLSGGRWKPVAFPSNTTLDGNNYKIYFNNAGFDLSNKPTEIGLFTTIPSGSVVKNLQVVFEHGNASTPVTTLEVDLSGYKTGDVNIGMIAGTNNGIITNCAVLSEWQFSMRNLNTIKNVVTDSNFTESLPFNKDHYLFDDNYFYELDDYQNPTKVVRVYNRQGYEVTKNSTDGAWDDVVYDEYRNVLHWITPDRTNVAMYDDYSPMLINEGTDVIRSVSPAHLYVYVNNKEMNVVLGGLVGTNANMITNSRVLVDVELYGPEQSTSTGAIDEVNVLSSIVGGVVGRNSGTITSTYFRDGNVTNNSNADDENKGTSILGGFVGQNTGKIQQSYAMGCSTERENNLNAISVAGAVKTIRNSLGGFVHVNSGTITDCLVNMVIMKTGTEGAAAGFVYQNTKTGVIKNCIENNNIILQSSGTLDYYAPFIYQNGDTAGVVNTKNLSNLIYAGNAESISLSDDWKGTLKRLSDNSDGEKNPSALYRNIKNYQGYSIGSDVVDSQISGKNAIWIMTANGPMLREANEIAVSFRKHTWNSSPYLYRPGTAKNPYLVWTEDQFNDYVYSATAKATAADKEADTESLKDIEDSRQNNYIRLVDNIQMTGIKDSYKIVYTGTLEGNGLTMSGIGLDTVTNDLATTGLFGKTEYATIRNINFEITGINSTARYVGGIAGIAINTNFVDIRVTSTGVIKGANIVGGFVGLNVVTDSAVENYNLYSSVSATANYHNQQTDVGAELFSSGIEYYRQTLYAKVSAFNVTYEQGYSTAGGVFGFVTSNPNNYRVVDEDGNVTIYARSFTKEIVVKSADGKTIYNQGTPAPELNSEHEWFLKDASGNVINDTVVDGQGLYYTDPITLLNITGEIKDISGNVAGGLIGIMDETIEMQYPAVNALASLTGKYYLGGLVGINLGKISGGVTTNDDGTTETYNAMTLNKWSILSSAGSSYVFRDNPATENATRFWGMSVGAVAGYNDGYNGNLNSGVIENINVDVNVLNTSSSVNQYIIGGVVGANGDYGYIENATNVNKNMNPSTILVSSAQTQKIGFYYGRTIGRSNTVSAAHSTVNGNVRMKTMQLNVPSYGNYGYVSLANFATPNYSYQGIDNAFGIVGDTTPKVQTMTKDEYMKYLSDTITTRDLPTRVAMLEPWVRSLPTIVLKGTTNSNGYVWTERYDDTERGELLSWVKDHNILNTWDGAHSALVDKVYDNYQSYLNYSAISTRPAGLLDVGYEDENGFMDNIKTYRENRYNQAIKFFTYQYNLTKTGNQINGTQNSEFTWDQFENYLILAENVNNSDLTSNNHNVAVTKLRQKYTNPNLADMLLPENELLEHAIKRVVNNTPITETVRTTKTVNENFASLVGNFDKNKDENGNVIDYTYTNKDPLQVYINYVTELARENNRFRVNNGWKLSFAQYCYYMDVLYGTNYGTNEKYQGLNYNYSIPANFTAISENNLVPAHYVLYIYINSMLDGTSNMLTIPEFIYLIGNEEKEVMENEEIWVKTGHMRDASRISSIGGVKLGWVNSAAEWNDAAKLKVSAKNGSVTYESAQGDVQWDAFTNYLDAKRVLGLSITKYKELIGLGGTLYDLIDQYGNRDSTGQLAENPTATEDYIFALKCEQYGWTDEQTTFIKNYYHNNGNYDLLYALAATTLGNVIDYTGNGNGSIRAAYATSAQIYDSNDDRWYADIDGDGICDEGEPFGIRHLRGINLPFDNGDGKTYYLAQHSIDLFGKDVNGKPGAALYYDIGENGQGGNKIFGKTDVGSGSSTDYHRSGPDILILYEVDVTDFHEFYTKKEVKDEYGNISMVIDKYYCIVRQIVDSGITMTNDENEGSGNKCDYLEEALWWRDQGFTADQFSKIKFHAMTKSLTPTTLANGNTSKPYPDATKNYTKRGSGYTLADDWYNTEKNSGFKNEDFTQDEYVEIVLGAEFNGDVWYSTYADYLLFEKLYNYPNTITINSSEIQSWIPETSRFNGIKTNRGWLEFFYKLADENVLADAIEFSSPHDAFMTTFRMHGSAAKFVTWTEEHRFLVNEDPKYLRLNHYIYWIKNDLENQTKIDGSSKFNVQDFRWVLTPSIRADIFYEGVNQEKRTNDLVAYRKDWFNDNVNINHGLPFITYRDYCEWINVYAYADEYKIDRGDLGDDIQLNIGGKEETIELKSTDAWLTIESFAVWKRMEKYENNIEYIAKMGSTDAARQNEITAPILKRQISTTVFPKIQSSGNKRKNQYEIEYGDYVLPQPGGNYVSWYRWGNNRYVAAYNDYNPMFKEEDRMDINHQRDLMDRFEYNERYKARAVNRVAIGNLGNELDLLKNATTLINDQKFALTCDDGCGGKNNPALCNNPLHAAFQVRHWIERYDYARLTSDDIPDKYDNIVNAILKSIFDSMLEENNIKGFYSLHLDEVNLDDLSFGVSLPTAVDDDNPETYAQLYVPFDYFKTACRFIKSLYNESNGYAGYHNYMKYWARNGQWNWICNTEEYSGTIYNPDGMTAFRFVNNTYNVKTFWDNYKGTTHALPDCHDPIYGWSGDWKESDQ